MTLLPTQDIGDAVALLRQHLGDARFWRFVASLRGRQGLLLFWQSKVLDELEASHKVELPRTCEELGSMLLPLLPKLPTLTERELPPWVVIDALEGTAPVQAWGTVEPRARWYFRSRHDDWSLAVSPDQAVDPADVFESKDGFFYHEEPYGHLRGEASEMPHSVARFFIVRELTRWRSTLPP